MSDISDKLNTYFSLNKELLELRKKQKEHKGTLDKLEADIKQYMTDNNMDSIVLNGGSIVLYERKVSKTFKKETIAEKLSETLGDQDKAENLAENIVSNKVFDLKPCIKVKLK